MLVAKGVMLQLLGMLIMVAMLLFAYGAVTGHKSNWVVLGILFFLLIVVREAYRRLR